MVSTSGTQLSASDKPNVLLILVDDAPDQSLTRMPAIKRELIGRGTRYSNSIATFPLWIRSGAVDDSLAGNLDISPTVAAMAGVDVPVAVDGRDFRHSNREALLAERPVPQNAWERRGNIPAWRAVRTADYKYVEYETGERELYRLTDDPYEIRNLHGRKPQVETRLAAKLNELKDCDADGCRKAEDP